MGAIVAAYILLIDSDDEAPTARRGPAPTLTQPPTFISTPVPPSASFSVDVRSGGAPLIVEFRNTSQGQATSLEWDFGDSTTSTEQSPIHQYTIAGSYTVRLTVSDPGGTDVSVMTELIAVHPGPPVGMDISPSNARLAVQEVAEFAAVVRDEFGNIVPSTPTWAISAEAGSISPTGVFSADTVAGTFDDALTASLQTDRGELVATASVTVEPGPVFQAKVQPSETNLEIGGTQSFEVDVLDEFGNRIREALIAWKSTVGAGTIDADGKFTTGIKSGSFPGAVQVEVVKGTEKASATAHVSIQPDPPAKIDVMPNLVIVKGGAVEQFTAVSFDQYGNSIPEIVLRWEATGGDIDQAGLFTAFGQGGRHEVRASTSLNGSAASGSASAVVPARTAPVLEWGGLGNEPGKLGGIPYGSAIDSHDYLYVSDCITGYIQKFTTSGDFVLRFGGDSEEPVPGKFRHPSDIAVDSGNNLYVVDELHDRIQIFDDQGTFLREYGETGSDYGQFNHPYSVMIDSNDNILVVESANHRVQKFDPEWNFITAWGRNEGDGTSGDRPGEFKNPWYSVIDSQDNVYVVDASNRRIQKFDAEGNFILKWGRNGDGPGEFEIPYEIAVDVADRIYVVDSNPAKRKSRIQVFDSDGDILYIWEWELAVEGHVIKLVSVDREGYVYATSATSRKVLKLPPFPLDRGTQPFLSSTTTRAPAGVVVWGGENDSGPGEIHRASGTTFDLDGFLYIADYSTRYVHKFSSDGDFIFRLGGPTEVPMPGKLMGPVDVAVDRNGHVYVVEWDGHRVQKFDDQGNVLMVLGEMGVAGELEGLGYGRFLRPYGISVDSKDNVYVIDGGNQRVQKFDQNGNFLTAWGANGGDGTTGDGPGEFRNPFMLAIDSQDNVYVVDQSNSRIQKFDSDGNFILILGANGSGPGELRNPLEIAIDNEDHVYVAELLNHRIQVFDSEGDSIYIWNVPWSEEDKVKTVAVDAEGYVYITTSATRQIMKLPPFPLE